MDVSEHIVEYDKYCHKCAHKLEKDIDDICNECLYSPTNTFTNRPINFKEDGLNHDNI